VETARPHRCAGYGDDGYTLAELLVVVVIVGILCTLAVPSFTGLTKRWRMEAALDRFQGSYAYGRVIAIRSGTPVELAFTPSARDVCLERISIFMLASPGPPVREVRVPEEFPGLCLMQNNPRPVRFDSRGMPRRTDNRSVWVRSGPMVDSLTISTMGNISRRF
jgi:prepilin-type N-terminal cleavage/methylation domain-containing protein